MSGKPSKPTRGWFQKSDPSLENPKQDTRWALFGPYMGQYVVYQSDAIAYVQSDELTSKLSRVVLMNSGTKIIRGWDEVENQLGKQPAKKTKSESGLDEKKDEELTRSTAEINEDPKPTPREIKHLLLVIHGIGQKLSEKIEAMSFTYDCDVLRNGLKDAANNMIAQFQQTNHPQKDLIPKDGGVQVLPIQWRQKMKVSVPYCSESSSEDDEDDAGLTVGDILPEGIPGIRMLVSDVILDVLLYMTPKYRQEMINLVSAEINRVYSVYKQRNPEFNGTVSIYGHSLGSVIGFDIATHQTGNDVQMKRSQSSKSTEVDISDLLAGNIDKGRVEGLMEPQVNIKSEKLLFDIDHLFTVGSPIGMFLLLGGFALRPPEDRDDGHPHQESNVTRPLVKSLYNIFHPYDPVAHRIEPMFSHRMTSLKPIPIHYSKGGLTQTVKGIEAARSEMIERGRSIITGLITSAGGMLTKISISSSQPTSETDLNAVEMTTTSKDASNANLTAKSPERRRSSVASTSKSPERKPTNPPNRPKPSSRTEPTASQQSVILKMKALNDHGRLDFALQESLLENPYLSSLGSHMNYWSDSDANALIIRALYHIQLNPNGTTYVA